MLPEMGPPILWGRVGATQLLKRRRVVEGRVVADSEEWGWIEKHFDYYFAKKLIISRHHGLLKGDVLIDDLVSGARQETVEGTIR